MFRLRSLVVLSKATDVSYYNAELTMWSSVELNVGIICACLPTIRPALKGICPRLLAGGNRPVTPTFDNSTLVNDTPTRGRCVRTTEVHVKEADIADEKSVDSKEDIFIRQMKSGYAWSIMSEPKAAISP